MIRGEYHYERACYNGECGPYGYGYKEEGLAKNLKVAQIASNNAGDGGESPLTCPPRLFLLLTSLGDASSGAAYGGSVAGLPHAIDSSRYAGDGSRYY